MVGHICEICKIDSLFFTWSSCRKFIREKMPALVVNPSENQINHFLTKDYVVCSWCCEKHHLIR